MRGPNTDWHPNWWAIWKAMGPAAGSNCSATFMSECGLQVSTTVVAIPTLLDQHFNSRDQSSSSAANFTLQSRKELAKQRASEAVMKQELGLSTPCTPNAHDARSSRFDTKSLLDVRRQEIQRLEYLRRSPSASADEQKAYELELYRYMQNPITVSSLTPVTPPSFLSDSSTTESSSSAAMASFIKGAQGASIQDAASMAFRPIMPPLDVQLDPLLAMPARDVSRDDNSTVVNHHQIESSVVSESTLISSCPVDDVVIAATDFANSCFDAPVVKLQVTPHTSQLTTHNSHLTGFEAYQACQDQNFRVLYQQRGYRWLLLFCCNSRVASLLASWRRPVFE